MSSEVAMMLENKFWLQAHFGFADLFLFRGKLNIIRFWEIAGRRARGDQCVGDPGIAFPFPDALDDSF